MPNTKNTLVHENYPFEVSRVTIDSNNLEEIITEAGYLLNGPLSEIVAMEFFLEYADKNAQNPDQHSIPYLLYKLQIFLQENFTSYKIMRSRNNVYFICYINKNYHMVISSKWLEDENIKP
ncbi:MAG: hypothetical protein ACXWDO_03785 [Bacteroidia bacterium]